MKKLKQAAKVLRIVFPLILLLVVNGCGDMSGTDDGVIGEDVVQQAVTVGSSYWTDYFSDENVAGYCRDGYLVTAMQCTGRYCDNMRMLCTYSGQKSIIKQTLSTFSEESPNSRICSNPYFVTQIQCTGDYCDNLTLSCSNFSYLQRNSADCYWTSSFSEEQSAMYLKSGYYLAGVKCTGSNCDNISMYGCRAVASPDGETTSNPMACYKGLCPTTSGTDSDGDGISDAYEAYLLEKFSPYFMFSYDNGRPEHFNPTDPAWYVNTSRMITYYEGTPFPNNYYTLAGSPLLPLYLGFDLTLKKKKDTACFDPGSGKGSQCATTQSYGDPNLGWYTIITQANIGLFGHVAPVLSFELQFNADLSFIIVPVIYYKIEYWQFFAWNDADQPLCIGNHQGDWCTVQLRYDPRNGKILDIHHWVHGNEVSYSMGATQVRANYVTSAATYMEYRGAQYYQNVSFDQMTMSMPNKYLLPNNVVRMFRDPMTLEYNHPMVYIEYGAHEFWPTENGEICQWGKCSPKHGTDGICYRYLTKSIPNFGEVESSNTPNNIVKLVLRFNGYWGCEGNNNDPPAGPALHKAWAWPFGSPLKTQLDNNGVDFE